MVTHKKNVTEFPQGLVIPAKEVLTTLQARNEAIAGRIAAKQMIKAEVSNLLHEVAAIALVGADKANEAQNLADKPTAMLFHAQVERIFTKDEVNEILGSEFGFVPKKDGTLGKTPFGKGQDIRKRVVRAVQAHEYLVDNGPCPAFLEGVDKTEAMSVLNTLNEGGSIWSAYDSFGTLKERIPVETAFDATRLSKIVMALREDGAAEKLANSPALLDTYAELLAAINKVDQDATAIIAARKAEYQADQEQGAGSDKKAANA